MKSDLPKPGLLLGQCLKRFKAGSDLRILKFAMVGGAGTLVNLLVFSLWYHLLHLNLNLSSILAFAVACSQNYLFNSLWTFRSGSEAPVQNLSLRKYFLYLASNVLGLLFNLLGLNLCFYLTGLPLLSQGFGILCGFILDYALASLVVFKRCS